ncbi:hypothetical protein CL634_01050, partial [bacterium]|nr:hypothetical protein [bacterium]
WPIFIFLLFANIKSVASLPIIISVTAMVFTYFIGGVAKAGRQRLILIGSLAITGVWLARLAIEGPMFFYISVFLVGLFSIMITIPVDSNIFEKGEKRDALSASVYRNASSIIGRFILYSVLLLLVNVFQVSFSAAALGVFLLLLLNVSIFKTKELSPPKKMASPS